MRKRFFTVMAAALVVSGMMRFVYLIRLQLVLNKQMHSVTYRGSKKKLLQKSIMRDMIT